MYNSYIVFIWKLVIFVLGYDKTLHISELGEAVSATLSNFNQLLCISQRLNSTNTKIYSYWKFFKQNQCMTGFSCYAIHHSVSFSSKRHKIRWHMTALTTTILYTFVSPTTVLKSKYFMFKYIGFHYVVLSKAGIQKLRIISYDLVISL